MPSPFPGMDPYLETEAGWGGFHQAFVVAVQAELNRLLPDGYRARIDEYVWVEDEPVDRRVRIKPDAFVPDSRGEPPGVATAARPTTAPTSRGRLPQGRQRRVRHVVVTGAGRQILTAIEVLSPSNKQTGEHRDVYLRKRREYLASVDLVELDLLRAGDRVPTGRPLPPPCDYLMSLCKAETFPRIDLWGISVRDPLPVLPVPVAGHPDCPLDLRACLDRVYDETRAAVDIDYHNPPEYPLRPADAAWAAELLKTPAKWRK